MNQILEMVKYHNSVDLSELEANKDRIIELIASNDPQLAEDALGAISRIALTDDDLIAISQRMQSRLTSSISVRLAMFSVLSNSRPLDSDEISTIESFARCNAITFCQLHHLSAIAMNLQLPEQSPILDTIYLLLEENNTPAMRSVRILYNLSRYISSDRLLRCVEIAARSIGDDRVVRLTLDKISRDILKQRG